MIAVDEVWCTSSFPKKERRGCKHSRHRDAEPLEGGTKCLSGLVSRNPFHVYAAISQRCNHLTRLSSSSGLSNGESAVLTTSLSCDASLFLRFYKKMTGYDEDGGGGLTAKAVDFFRLRGRLEASPFHFINLGVLAYIGMGQVRSASDEGRVPPLPIF